MDELDKFIPKKDRVYIRKVAQKHGQMVLSMKERESRFYPKHYLELHIHACKPELMNELFADPRLGKYDLVVRMN